MIKILILFYTFFFYQPTGQCYEEHNYCHPDSKFFDYQKFGVDFTRPLVDWYV